MVHIVAGILSLTQYLNTLTHQSTCPRLERCLHCGKAHPWLHGGYFRKADRSGKPGESLNPIIIQRFFCPACRKTCSVLPECIAPRRWYLWEVQQAALLAIVAGKSLYATAKAILPSRHTISRWVARFKSQFQFHKASLCGHWSELGRACDFADFWQTCLTQMLLSQAMRLCHAAGEVVP